MIQKDAVARTQSAMNCKVVPLLTYDWAISLLGAQMSDALFILNSQLKDLVRLAQEVQISVSSGNALYQW